MMMSSLGKEYLLEWEILEERFRFFDINAAFYTPDKFHMINKGGSYVLALYLPRPFSCREWSFPKGIYLYVGKHKNNINKRLMHHIKKHKKQHWHIDILTSRCIVMGVWHFECKKERDIANFLSTYYFPIRNFGNTDDRESLSHLFYLHPLNHIINVMHSEGKKLNAPVYNALKHTKDKFERFLFVFLSSRTKDEKTLEITKKLLKRCNTWECIRSLPIKELENILYGVAFYKQKAKNLKIIAQKLRKREVPKTLQELVSLPGVGIKIAKVFLSDVYGSSYIGVDVHVHRISNRIGLVSTSSPLHTDRILNERIPNNLKPKFNISLVGYGQTICKPTKPKCEQCKIKEYCMYYISTHISSTCK